MSISKGGQSVKPYVGSKEVKEAYVGTQKVYSAAPPIYYGFLGAENDYVIADWCQLKQNAAIVKESGVYRIAMSETSVPALIALTDIKGPILKFTAKAGPAGGTVGKLIIYYIENGTQKELNTFQVTSSYSLYNLNIPSTATQIIIRAEARYELIYAYIDAIRFETE